MVKEKDPILKIDHGDESYTIIDTRSGCLIAWDPEAGRLGLTSSLSVKELNEIIDEDDLAGFLWHLSEEQINLVQESLLEIAAEG